MPDDHSFSPLHGTSIPQHGWRSDGSDIAADSWSDIKWPGEEKSSGSLGRGGGGGGGGGGRGGGSRTGGGGDAKSPTAADGMAKPSRVGATQDQVVPPPISNKHGTRLNAALERMFHSKRRPKRRSSLPSDPAVAAADLLFRAEPPESSADETTRVSHFATTPRKKPTFLKARHQQHHHQKEASVSSFTEDYFAAVSGRPTAEFVTAAASGGDSASVDASDASTESEASAQGSPSSHTHKLYFPQVYVDHLKSCAGTEEYHGRRKIRKHLPAMRRSKSEISLPKKYGVPQEVIGQGTCSTVRVARKPGKGKHEADQLFAVKEFNCRHEFETERDYVKRLIGEFCISSTLSHINIIRTLELVEDEQHKWHEISEYCPGGDLYVLLNHGTLSPTEADCYFKQLTNGIAYLHDMGVAHRDIKPENILLDATGCLKITDFGNSEVFRTAWEKEAHMSHVACGDSAYMSPEEFIEETIDPRKADIWAIGIVYLAMVHNSLPWRSASLDDNSYQRYAEAYGMLAKPSAAEPPTPPAAEEPPRASAMARIPRTPAAGERSMQFPRAGPREPDNPATSPTSLFGVLSLETTVPLASGDGRPPPPLPPPPSLQSMPSSPVRANPGEAAASRACNAPGLPAPWSSSSSPTTQQQLPVRASYGPGYALIAALPPHKGAVVLAILDPDPSGRPGAHEVLASPWLVETRECHVPGGGGGGGGVVGERRELLALRGITSRLFA